MSFIQRGGASRNTWGSATVPVDVKEKGVFLVEAVYGDLRAYTILVVSDIVLLTKTGRSHVLAFLADRETGEPVENASISVMARKGEPATVKTNSDGLTDNCLYWKPARKIFVLSRIENLISRSAGLRVGL